MQKPYNILEVANVHAGNFKYMMDLLDEFTMSGEGFGIKFQPFKYDKIALPDYAWYKVYEKLYFNKDQWRQIIDKAAATKDVWIDTFDEYSYEIAEDNLEKVFGFKFQASTLYNVNLIQQFSQINLRDKIIILNISGIPQEQIADVVDYFTQQLQPKEIILQIGFQAYPTQLIDSGLSKIKTLKKEFANRLCFADHIDPELEDAYMLPVVAYLMGTQLIEKHIRLSGPKPEYDYYSSMDLAQYKKYLTLIDGYTATANQSFINENESSYLKTTVQIPVLSQTLNAGDIPNINKDFAFKRSNLNGLRANEIRAYLQDYHILRNNKQQNETLLPEDFKKANIGAVIACRMKSSRLPQKAIEKIGDITSVELCIKSALAFKNVNKVVLATSDLEEDAILDKYTYRESVAFYKGHPLDVMQRVQDVLEKYELDVFVRITADMPYVSNDILEILLDSHFKNGADYTRARHAAIGTNLEIINTAALRKAKSYFPNADYSEYMTYYFTNNEEHFRLNIVDLPEHLVRDYRLTLDYREDLELFNNIHNHLAKNNQETTLPNIFKYLDAHPEVAAINSGMEVRYHTDQTLIDTLNKYTKIPA